MTYGRSGRELVQGNEKLQQESARVHEDLARSQREVEKAQDEVALCRNSSSALDRHAEASTTIRLPPRRRRKKPWMSWLKLLIKSAASSTRCASSLITASSPGVYSRVVSVCGGA